MKTCGFIDRCISWLKWYYLLNISDIGRDFSAYVRISVGRDVVISTGSGSGSDVFVKGESCDNW